MAKPWSRTKAKRRGTSLDSQWAEGLSDRLIGACHPPQKAAVEDKSRRVSFLVGRGGGKTTALRARAVRKMATLHRARIIYVALSRPTAKHLNWEPLKELISKLGETENFEFSESELTATCTRTGSTYRMVGAEDRKELEKLRGQPFDEVQIDESASFDPDLIAWLIDRVVGPRLGERNGCIVMCGTPGHVLRGPFYDATRRGSTKHQPYSERKTKGAKFRGWSSHAWTLLTVVGLRNAKKLYPAQVALWKEALIEKGDQQWSDENPIWRREYLGEWAADDTENVYKYRPHLEDGTPWNQWDPFNGKTLDGVLALRAAIDALPKVFTLENKKEIIPSWHFVECADKGHTDPFANTVLAFAPNDPKRRIWHVYSFEQPKIHAKPFAEQLVGPESVERLLTGKAAEPYGGIFGVIGWPDGLVVDGDPAFIDELANVYGIQFERAERRTDYKYGAIELVNGDLIDGRILVIKDSPLELQLLALQWKANENGRLLENKAQANHSTDTLVYGRRLIAKLFEMGAVNDEKPRGAYEDPLGLGAEETEPGEFDSLLSDGTYVDLFGNG